MSALKRLNREYRDLLKNSSDYWSARPKDMNNMFIWEANIHNLQDSRHRGKDYTLEIIFTEKHPFVPPKVRFIDKVHCENIFPDGTVCIDILQNEWSPAIAIEHIMISLCSVLTDTPVTGAPSKLVMIPQCSHSVHGMITRSRILRLNTIEQNYMMTTQ